MRHCIRPLERRRWLAALVTAQGLFTPSFAQIPPGERPPRESPGISAAAKIDLRLTADLRLGDLRVEFGKTGLRTVGQDMHNLVIGHTPEKGAESGLSWLCFTVVRNSYAERWWLMSDDEFGGAPEYAITRVFAQRVKPSVAPTATCPEPSPKFLPARLDERLWVGSRAAEIDRVIGRKPLSTGWHRYSNVSTQTDSHGTERVVRSWLDVKVEAGAIVAIRAMQMSSF